MKTKNNISRREFIKTFFALAAAQTLTGTSEAQAKKRKEPSTYEKFKAGAKKRWDCAAKELPKTDPLTKDGWKNQQQFFPKCFPDENKIYGVVKKFFFSP